MANNTKVDAKKPATTKKHNINFRKLIKRFVAKPLAYLTVFVLASYGMRQMLKTLDDRAAGVLTILAILALCWIIVDSND